MRRAIPIALCSLFFLTRTDSMIMRNNALMSKMVSNFQDKAPAPGDHQASDSTNVIMTMKKVLCRNFQTIPCELIMKDPSLQRLVEMSVQQIKNKKLMLEDDQAATTTHFPGIDSEDLSNFLQVSHTGLYDQRNKNKNKKSKKATKMKNVWSHERGNGGTEAKLFSGNGRKKVRKFYPHKIKDKKADFSEEDQSNSVEVDRPNVMRKKRRRFNFRGYREASDPPAWRIDYMKHGEPSFNLFSMSNVGERGDTLRTKLIKQVPNVVMDNLVEQAERRDVMHPDVYIKKNIVTRNSGRENLLELS